MTLEDCVEQAFSLVPTDVRARFAAEPIKALQSDFGLTVQAVEHLVNTREDGGACDGISFLEDGVILYAPTPASRRENFTLAHELGHWLAENAPDVYDWLANQDDPGRLLETVCDRIAQRLLLPDSAAETVIGSGPVRAQHLIDLYSVTNASRPVCAIALAKHLPGLGAIAIIDRYGGAVTHSSVNPDPEHGWPTVFPWRNQRLDGTHPLLRLSAGSSMSRRLTWSTPWSTQAEFYVNVLADEKRIIAVFSDADLWGIEQFHPGLDRDFVTRPLLTGYCCGASFERRGFPCSECQQPYCPQCGDCRCDRDAKREVMCDRCFLRFQPHLVVGGLCVDCRS
ncbi:ImmA/IrrE family metallo-endopeptidase [Mycobacterium sp. E735]|uniref:ImmA/IrrE family metallo-endopeptidase n=1 Tax=Mycobacterium sp. E735 TaxID=1834148 RepID=UPI0018D4D285|nr:ImmA/IrrE family metallo-endopeptidase [Mycobacterium sp. E735]